MRMNLQLFAKKSVTEVAREVIKGNYGNGATRKNKLTSAGYNYNEVQSEVNRLLGGNSSAKTTTSNKSSSNSNKNNNKSLPTINGTTSAMTEDVMEEYKPSENLTNKLSARDEATNNYNEYINNTEYVSPDVYETLKSKFVAPESYNKAMSYIEANLGAIQSGRTSYTDKVSEWMSKLENREKFEYDVDEDPLFQQALASAMNSGRTAMQDTIGQASSLTGGYGSTYATSVGNQAYNSFIEDAYNNLPQYYNMALQAYQMEGEEMFNMLGMYMDADQNEFNRLVAGFDATSQYADSVYNKAFNEYTTNIDNAYKSANLQLSEKAQKSSDLLGLANLYGNQYATDSEIERGIWGDTIAQRQYIYELANSDYWADQSNQIAQAELGLKENEYKISTGDTNGDGVLSKSEKAAMNQQYTYDENGKVVKVDSTQVNAEDFKISDTELKEVKAIWKQVEEGTITAEEGEAKINSYFKAKGKDSTSDYAQGVIADVLSDSSSTLNPTSKADETSVDYWKNVDIVKTKDTTNGFLGIGGLFGRYDNNDEFKVGDSIYTLGQIAAKLRSVGIKEDSNEYHEIINQLSDMDEDETYNFTKRGKSSK